MADEFLRSIDWSTLDWRDKTAQEAEHIQGYFARFFASKTKAEVTEGATQRRIMIQSMCSPLEILAHPQLAARDYWQDVEYPHLGLNVRYPARSCTPSGMPCGITRRAPRIGEHNLEIYGEEMGMTHDEIAVLRQTGTL